MDSSSSRRGYVPCLLSGLLRLFIAGFFDLSAGAAEVTYAVRDLGTLGGESSRAYAINERGWIAGEAEAADGNMRAFLWTPETGMRDLGTLGGASSRAYAINDRGEVAGEAEDADGHLHPFRWSAEHGMEKLPMPPDMRDGFIHALNNFGVLVGGAESDEGPRALVWTVDGVRVPPAIADSSSSAAHAVNDVGMVAGRIAATGEQEWVSLAFFIDSPSETNARLPGPHHNGGSAVLGLNARGDAVGFVENGRALRAARFLAGPPLVIEGLDTLDSAYSLAYDLNDAGEAVGLFASSHEDDDRAFVWRGGAMLDLNEWVETAVPWYLVEARSINNRGEIAGYGLLHERERAVLLTPNPASAYPRPGIRLIAPQSGAIVRADEPLVLETHVDSPGARVRRVMFYANGVIIGSTTAAPHRFVWQKPAPGEQNLVAIVVSEDGRLRRSARVAVAVGMNDASPATTNFLQSMEAEN